MSANATHMQVKTKRKRKNVYFMATPYVPRNLKSKKKWKRDPGTPNKRQRARLEAKAFKEYQEAMVGLGGRLADPVTTKELCQDSFGILEEMSEHGFNEHRYLQLSNHLMKIHKNASEANEANEANEALGLEFFEDRRGTRTHLAPTRWVDDVDGFALEEEREERRDPYAEMGTSDLLREFMHLAGPRRTAMAANED